MRVRVKLIATYRQHLPPGTRGDTVELEVAAGSTVADVLQPFGIPLDDSSVIRPPARMLRLACHQAISSDVFRPCSRS